MKQHLQLMDDILSKGRRKVDRTGVGTVSLFGPQIEFDLSEGFPVVTTREISIAGILEELMWFLRGDTNNEILRARGVKFWTRWALTKDYYDDVPLSNADRAAELGKFLGKSSAATALELQSFKTEEAGHLFMDAQGIPRMVSKKIASRGDLGPIYGKMWRSWPTPDGNTVDQIAVLIKNLVNLPFSRRHVVSGWNPALLPDEKLSHEENILSGKQCLPPCHTAFQFIVEPLTIDEQIDMYRGGRDAILAAIDSVTGGMEIDDKEPFIEQMLRESKIPDKMLSCKLFAR